MSEDKTLVEVLQEALDERRDAAPAGGDLEAEKYVDGRWGHQSRGQRKRLIEAFKAGVKRERNRPAPSRPEDRGAAPCGIYYAGGRQCTMRPEQHDPALNHVYTPAPTPPRDPAGEGEVACECDRPKDWLGHRFLFLRSLVDGEPRHEFRARPSSPTGETPCPAGRTDVHQCDCLPPCDTCGGGGKVNAKQSGRWRRIDCPDCQPPTGETAGQGVEEAWTRSREVATGPGSAAAVWRRPRPRGGYYEASVPLAVEQAVRAEALAEYAEGHDMHCENEARATAAEAERDRLREAVVDYLRELDRADLDPIHSDDERILAAERKLRDLCPYSWPAFAGESTGAGEGE